jgi:hypothetical protein
MTSERFWVIGGEYNGMDFQTLKDGARRVLGPYASRDDAARVWRQVSDETRSLATARFAIAAERLVLPA